MDFSLDFPGPADIASGFGDASAGQKNAISTSARCHRAALEVMRDAVVEKPERTEGTECGCSHSAFKASGEIIRVHIRGRNPRTGNSDNSMKAKAIPEMRFTGALWSWER